MAIIDIIILVAFGLGAIIGFMKGFVKQFGLSAGADCRSAGSKGFVCLVGSEAVPHIDRLYDSGASTGICPHLAGCSLALLPGGFSADPGNGGRLAGLAQSLVGSRSGGFEVPPVDEPADWCHRIYRRRQYADWQNKKERISVILSYGRVCRDILSRGKGGYGADCKRRL